MLCVDPEMSADARDCSAIARAAWSEFLAHALDRARHLGGGYRLFGHAAADRGDHFRERRGRLHDLFGPDRLLSRARVVDADRAGSTRSEVTISAAARACSVAALRPAGSRRHAGRS